MKKCFLLLLSLCFSIVVFAQSQSYKGFYQARFINLLESVSFIEAEFEVTENNSVSGTVKIGDDVQTLRGTIKSQGKFEVRSETVNGYTVTIKGDLSVKNTEKKVTLVRRFSETKPGDKKVSENSISGFVKQILPPSIIKDTETPPGKISDNGRTQLLFEHENPLFGKEWNDFPASAKFEKSSGQLIIVVEMKSAANDAERRFRFRLIVENEKQRTWLGRNISVAAYSENKRSADGEEIRHSFIGTANSLSEGQIEVVSENEKEMTFKITNLQIKKLSKTDTLTIDGYIYAQKTM